jgi:hypothetical protein
MKRGARKNKEIKQRENRKKEMSKKEEYDRIA